MKASSTFPPRIEAATRGLSAFDIDFLTRGGGTPTWSARRRLARRREHEDSSRITVLTSLDRAPIWTRTIIRAGNRRGNRPCPRRTRTRRRRPTESSRAPTRRRRLRTPCGRPPGKLIRFTPGVRPRRRGPPATRKRCDDPGRSHRGRARSHVVGRPVHPRPGPPGSGGGHPRQPALKPTPHRT